LSCLKLIDINNCKYFSYGIRFNNNTFVFYYKVGVESLIADFLYGPFCHATLILELSALSATCFLWSSLQFIFNLQSCSLKEAYPQWTCRFKLKKTRSVSCITLYYTSDQRAWYRFNGIIDKSLSAPMEACSHQRTLVFNNVMFVCVYDKNLWPLLF